MLVKNTFGILILIFNAIGLGYLLYLASLFLLKIGSPQKKIKENPNSPAKRKKPQPILEESVIPDEDDLLKDMDLSDLDNLNLDDFE
jgi:hypothetical protein